MLDFQDWNHKRIKAIIENYSHKFFYYKQILDLGAGNGEVGAAFMRLGADTYAIEAKDSYIKIINKNHPRIKVNKSNIEESWDDKRFDLILNMDLLHYLKNPEDIIVKCCGNAVHLVIETPVLDTEDENEVATISHNPNSLNSVNNYGILLSEKKIESILTNNGFSFVKYINNKLNSGNYVYDWSPSNSKDTSLNKRRMWFASKIGQARIPSSIETQRNQIIYPQPKPIIHNSSNLKVALCLSGYLRTFDRTYISLKQHVLNKLNPDIFIHIWDMTDNYHQGQPVHRIIERVKSLYNPKDIIMESASTLQVPPHYQSKTDVPHRSAYGVASMFYKVMKCNELKSNYENLNGTYDVVIRSRPDVMFNSPLNITGKLQDNILYVPKYGDYGGLNDQMAYGSSETMNKYSSLYSNFHNYVQQGMIINPEKMLKYHVDNQQLTVLRDEVYYVLLRMNGSRFDNYQLENSWKRR